MSSSNDVSKTKKKSILNQLTKIFRKKKRPKSYNLSTDQGQTNGETSEVPKDDGSSKNVTINPDIKVNQTSDPNSLTEVTIVSMNSTIASETPSTSKNVVLIHPVKQDEQRIGTNSNPNENPPSNGKSETTNSEASKSFEEQNYNANEEFSITQAINKDVHVSTPATTQINRRRNYFSNDNVALDLDRNLKPEELKKGIETELIDDPSVESAKALAAVKKEWLDNHHENLKQKLVATESAERTKSTETITRTADITHSHAHSIRTKINDVIEITETILHHGKHVQTEEFENLSEHQTDTFILVEKQERDPDEDYFTKGKYLSYFFLQMERQYHDPSKVYSMVRYHEPDDSDDSDWEGDDSSSESTSPNIPVELRRRLLHRRSADNLMMNSPTNSMRYSSPESVRSAPIQLKPRSTSHDALLKKKDKQTTQADGVSMDSLAKQALLAAQVLNLIPTQKARDRNFLHGRIAANSLLGPVELEKVLPNREIKIFVGTWNMNGQTPPKELNDFMLPSGIETVPDMLAIGTQESCSERNEWEAALQETLGPSHVLLTSTNLGTLHLALFVRRDLIWFCSVPEDANFSTRTGTAFRTKGAVALAVMLFGTSFLFVTAHLTAHQDKVKERVNDIKRIVRNLDLPKDLPTKHKNRDVTQNFDCVFWCGDLNFRLAQPREEVIQWISDTKFPQENPINLHKDQLRTILNEGAVLRGFEEGDIMFPPTYKYDPGSQNFDSSNKQRTPAYTDRILFKGKGHTKGYIRRVSCESTSSNKDGSIECLIYDSVPSICTSDHKPVWGVFKTTIRPGIDTIPLAAGLFNREVYLEGIKRRAAAMDESYGTSRVCSIQ